MGRLATIWFTSCKRKYEILSMEQAVNNIQGWLGAALAVAIVFGSSLIRKHVPTATLFSVTRYAFLVFAIWFGYEAWEHLGDH